MNEIKNRKFPLERDLYGIQNSKIINCRFEGVEDGESALKETKDIIIKKCYFDLRYPIWHFNNVKIYDSEMTTSCRAALWYGYNLKIKRSKLNGIKVVRECKNVRISDSEINSQEFAWKSKKIEISNSKIISEYAFFDSKKVVLGNTNFFGKYSFQYIDGIEIIDSVLDTKDAFWHSKNVVVKNSIIKGEYLGWYSENLTFINCKIIGTQPLCYFKNLKLIDCEMIDTDLSFEYSEVEATIRGNVLSIKNPYKGRIEVDSIDKIILTSDSKYPSECLIIDKSTIK